MSKNRGGRKRRWGKHEDHRSQEATVQRPRRREDEPFTAEELQAAAADLLELADQEDAR